MSLWDLNSLSLDCEKRRWTEGKMGKYQGSLSPRKVKGSGLQGSTPNWDNSNPRVTSDALSYLGIFFSSRFGDINEIAQDFLNS